LKERAAGDYQVLPYFLAKSVLEIPGMFFPAILSSVIVYWLANLNPSASGFFTFFACIGIHQSVVISLFGAVGAISPSTNISLILAPFILTVFYLLGGFFIPAYNIPPWYSWLGFVSTFKYSTSILVINEFANNSYVCDTNACGGENGTVYGYEIQEDIGINENLDIWSCFIILVGMAIVYKVLTFLFIYAFHRQLA
jgi:ABC-type multidrug transport system permease subunit